ncbi:MAG: hypothetical protein U0R68_16230 [Candidatus Nanopelagicales bacterium]
MITDDQVATLLRDAGNAGPLPAPIDPQPVIASARRARTRAAGFTGLAALAVVVGLVLVRPVARGRTVVEAGSGAASSSVMPLLVAGGLLVAVAVLLVVTALLARGSAPTSLRRLAPAAVAAILALSFLLVTVPYLGTLLWYGPSVVQASWFKPGGALVATLLVLTWLAVWTRQRLLGRPGSSVVTTAWVVLSSVAGLGLYGAVAIRIVLASRSTWGWTLPIVLLVLAAACVAGRWLPRVRHVDRRTPRSLGLTLLLACSVAAVCWFGDFDLLRGPVIRWSSWFVVAGLGLVPVAVALLGAWLAEPVGERRRRRALGLWAAVLLVVAAGHELRDLLWAAVAGSRHDSVPGYAVWAVGLVALAVVAVVALDRRAPAAADEDPVATSGS